MEFHNAIFHNIIKARHSSVINTINFITAREGTRVTQATHGRHATHGIRGTCGGTPPCLRMADG